MTWLDARDEFFFERYPYGVWLYDATGRRLENVVACNTETGEVIISMTGAWSLSKDLVRWFFGVRGLRWYYAYRDEIPKRHGFWPSPLRVAPKRVWIDPG